MPAVAVAAAAAVVAAIAALLLFYASYYLIVLPLQKVTTGAPWPVSWILGTLGGAEKAVIDWVGAWLANSVYPIVALLWVRYEGHAQNAQQASATADSLVAAQQRVANATAVNLGTAQSKLQKIDQRFGGATKTVAAIEAGLAADAALTAYIHGVQVQQAQAAAVAEAAAQREAAITAEHTAMLANGSAVWHDLLNRVGAEATARAQADAKVAADAAAADVALRTSIATTEAELQALERGRVRDLERELSDVTTTTIPAVQAREATDVAAIESTLATQAARLDCLDPLCSSGFAGLIGQLMTGAELLAILELAGTIIHDPEGAAQDVGGFVGGIVKDAEGLLSTVVGAL